MILRQLGEDEAFFRIITPRYAHAPTSGAGAAARGGRFNRPGQEALYLSGTAETAVLEYQQAEKLVHPGTLVTFLVSRLQVVDFSQGYVSGSWDPAWADYSGNWRKIAFEERSEPPSWLLADLSRDAGAGGLLFPSVIDADGINLVVFDSTSLPSSMLRVHDPRNDLPKDAASWPDPR